MTARIVLHCDTQWQYGCCPKQLLTDADTITEARTAAHTQGWVTHSTGRDTCPACSGHGPQTAGAVVAVLHPERTP